MSEWLSRNEILSSDLSLANSHEHLERPKEYRDNSRGIYSRNETNLRTLINL